MAIRILLVDDEPLILKGLRFSLQQEGYEIDQAADGEEALSKILHNTYDLILLDVMLPKLSGIEVCQRVRETSDVPIIMLTAKGEDMDKILGLEYGADDYMTKPFNILEVKARIKTILRRASGRREPQKTQLTSGRTVPRFHRPLGGDRREACQSNCERVRSFAAFHGKPRPCIQPGGSSGNDLGI